MKASSGFWIDFDKALIVQLKQFALLASHIEETLTTKRNQYPDPTGQNDFVKFMLVQTHGPGWYTYGEALPQLARQALFLTAFGYVENHIDLMVSLIEHHHNVKVSDLRDQGLTRLTNYLEKVSHINMPCGSLGTPEMKLLNTLRNQIAHNRAHIREKDRQLFHRTLKTNKCLAAHISINEHFNVELSSGLVPYLLDNAELTYARLWEQILESDYCPPDMEKEDDNA